MLCPSLLYSKVAQLYTYRHSFFFSFFIFWPTECGILVPRLGMEPAPPVVEAGSLNHQGSPYIIFFGGGVCWVFVAAHGLSLVAVSRGYSSLQCAGFSLLQSTGPRRAGFSSCGSGALERRLSSCPTWA